jgi:hypothetical protein
MELGSRRVWSINRGCLLLLGTWSHLLYIRGYLLAHLFLWLVTPTCVSRLITLWYLSHVIQGWIEIMAIAEAKLSKNSVWYSTDIKIQATFWCRLVKRFWCWLPTETRHSFVNSSISTSSSQCQCFSQILRRQNVDIWGDGCCFYYHALW